jgi:hypothetical protein
MEASAKRHPAFRIRIDSPSRHRARWLTDAPFALFIPLRYPFPFCRGEKMTGPADNLKSQNNTYRPGEIHQTEFVLLPFCPWGTWTVTLWRRR